jgi:hypothetical protein
LWIVAVDGMPPTNGSATRDADDQSAATVHFTTRTSRGDAFVWHV